MGVDEPELLNMIVSLVGSAIGVFWGICFVYGLNSEKVEPLKIPDRFDIGYIDADKPATTVIEVKSEKKKKKKKVQPKPVESTLDDKLVEDCTHALVALGCKKRDSLKRAKEILSSNSNITTAEQFVVEAFKK